MKVVLTTLGKFHSFDLARQLHARGALAAIFSGYPRFKLKGEGLPGRCVRTFPYLHTPYMAAGWRDRFGLRFLRQWEYWDRTSLDRFVARSLPEAEVFVGLSSCGLATGREAKRRGMKYVCDRGSTHIRHQDEVLREGTRAAGAWSSPASTRASSSAKRPSTRWPTSITVPSTWVRDTFLARGLRERQGEGPQLRRGPASASIRSASADPDGGFDVLFVGGMSLRKGVPYLLRRLQGH